MEGAGDPEFNPKREDHSMRSRDDTSSIAPLLALPAGVSIPPRVATAHNMVLNPDSSIKHRQITKVYSRTRTAKYWESKKIEHIKKGIPTHCQSTFSVAKINFGDMKPGQNQNRFSMVDLCNKVFNNQQSKHSADQVEIIKNASEQMLEPKSNVSGCNEASSNPEEGILDGNSRINYNQSMSELFLRTFDKGKPMISDEQENVGNIPRTSVLNITTEVFTRRGISFVAHLEKNIEYTDTLSNVCKVFSSFSGEKAKLLRSIGFDGLCSFPVHESFDLRFYLWVLTKIDVRSSTINLGANRIIPIQDYDISLITGLPCRGHSAIRNERSPLVKRSHAALVKRFLSVGNQDASFTIRYVESVVKRNFSTPMTTEDPVVANHDPVGFKRDFMLYVLCVYFAPSSGHVINRGYSPIISNVDLIKEMNWCDHVAEFLIEGIREYRESKAVNVNVHGCVHVLLLIYIDLVKSAIIKVPEGTPRANFVTSDLLELLDYHDVKFISADGPEYGKLEIEGQKPAQEHNESIKNCPTPEVSGHQSRPSSNDFLDGMSKIDADYQKSRDIVYEDCFRMLRSKMSKIDSIRLASITALHDKTSRARKEGISPRDTCNIFFSSQKSTCGPKETHSPDILVHTPLDTAHPEQSSFRNFSPQVHTQHVGPVLNPLELSFQVFSANRNENTKSSFPCGTPSSMSAVPRQNFCPVSVQPLPNSPILQQNCNQLSTIIVSTEEGNLLMKSALPVKPARLFQEEERATSFSSEIDMADHIDPLGFDIMSEVSAIGKEATKQAVYDAEKEDMLIDVPSTRSCSNGGGTCGLPILCGQAQYSTMEDNLPSCNDHALKSQQEINSEEGIQRTSNVECNYGEDSISQFSETFCSSDSLENAAALIEGDNIITEKIPDNTNLGDSDDISFAPVSDMSDIATQPPPSSCQFDTTGSEDNLLHHGALYIPDSPDHAPHLDVASVQSVGSPIPCGECFADAGSVNPSLRSRAKRFEKSEGKIDGIAELKKMYSKIKSVANQTYIDHVEKSTFIGTKRREHTDPARNCGGKTKIRIRGVHVTEEEFVHTLMPNGEVDLRFMWLCSIAIMLDWASSTKIIMNQSIINELMKPHDSCDHQKIADKLKSLRLNLIDQIYMPVRNHKQWILVLISISGALVEIYDTMRICKKGEDPYHELLDSIGSNLQIAYSVACSKDVPIKDKFRRNYAQIQSNNNLHDSGLEVIRLLVCHNGKDPICYGKDSEKKFVIFLCTIGTTT